MLSTFTLLCNQFPELFSSCISMSLNTNSPLPFPLAPDNHRVTLFLSEFDCSQHLYESGIIQCLPFVTAVFYTPTISVQGFQFLHILAKHSFVACLPPFSRPPSSSPPCPPSFLPSPPLSTLPSSSYFTPPNMCEVVSRCDFDLHFPKDLGGSSKEHVCQCRRHKRYGFNPWGREDPLEKSMETHSSILVCRILWTEMPGGLHRVHGVTQSQTWLKWLSTHKDL